ncbi:hypothetical protein BD410DRAFT_572460 [Rickenella mellea]|uniref:Calcium uniporter protein, mitochondrial n=1 Tax=Rickenella mellea TaxID=50990 RepID=A0A4Y7QEX2_9AGAM|nr:hypothetical protein BD410DRAFT_572460 [Rickenella mellea]
MLHPFHRDVAGRIFLCVRSSHRRHVYLRAFATATPKVKSTLPSSSDPQALNGRPPLNADRGYLAFTKASLYKLTLPLAPPMADHDSSATTESTAPPDPPSSHVKNAHDSERKDHTWEQEVESGNRSRPQDQSRRQQDSSPRNAPSSVVFLLHSGQPLSYISGLIRAENFSSTPSRKTPRTQNQNPNQRRDPRPNEQDITFHTHIGDGRRWSASTGIGDFLRHAAGAGSFDITIGDRNINVNVPSFEERTQFLRASLHEKTGEIERLAHVKDACDREAHQATKRVAIAGAGILGVWWVSVGVLTFNTDLGWETMEPITYLTGLGTVISGYLWFLWHNREVSYRTVLTETTSRRQQKLYVLQGFNIDKYQELIEDVKELRKAIKRVAWDYDLSWDQGNTDAGKEAKRALEIVRKEERKEEEPRSGTKRVKKSIQEDSDGDGQPDEMPEEDEDAQDHSDSKRRQ